MILSAACAVLIAAVAWTMLRLDANPATVTDTAALGLALIAHLVEHRVARRLWTGEMSAAHPARLLGHVAITVLSAGFLWRWGMNWPFRLADVASEAAALQLLDQLLANKETLGLYGLNGSAALIGAGAGIAESWRQLSGLMFSTAGGDRRRRARSDLHGAARLMNRREIARLRDPASARNIIIGQLPGLFGPKFVTCRLDGSALTYAPPQSGKTTQVIANLLDPDYLGWQGSTLTIDMRGNVYCVTARSRRSKGRHVRLVDPFGIVGGYARTLGAAVNLPVTVSESLNPLDLVRLDENHDADIDALLRVMLENPRGEDNSGASRHFHGLALVAMKGMISWVKHACPPRDQNLLTAFDLCLSPPRELEALKEQVGERIDPHGHLTLKAIQMIQRIAGVQEGGSLETTIRRQAAFLNNHHLRESLRSSSFDPMGLADGDTDIFIVLDTAHAEMAAPWLRIWLNLPTIVAGRRRAEGRMDRDILVFFDEMPAVGYMEPVMQSFTTAAGNGVFYWCIAQSQSALDRTWGPASRKVISDNADISQVLKLSPKDHEMAAALSKAIGHATYHNRSESRSAGSRTNTGGGGGVQDQVSASDALVREAVLSPYEIQNMDGRSQIVLVSGRGGATSAMQIEHARYWEHGRYDNLPDPDPVLLGTRARNTASRRNLGGEALEHGR